MRLSLFNNEDEPEVSMSPLIDCVFLLLIFFLVSTMTKVKNRDIPVDLPTSQSAIKLKPDDKQAIVGLDADGNFYWGRATLLNQFYDGTITADMCHRSGKAYSH